MMKRLWIGFLIGMWLCMTACSSKQVRLDTGQAQTESAVKEVPESYGESPFAKEDTQALIYVYVCGCVESPGVYTLTAEDRMYQAIEMAGGVSTCGDVTRMNLAEKLSDGQRIYVPSAEEAETASETEDVAQRENDGKININQASREELTTLSGIGESKADAILAYRQEHGGFETIEELMNVPGIKEGTYAKIKDRISIN